ncbi:MAG TPA: hypothetical protein VMW41_01140 [Candidatus Bathyarchaeia archaeon]|nr:hypothetical protein [Candidatus Bathyarchaeia archaeon]
MKKSTRKRKNFLPALLITLLSWTAWLLVFLKVAPSGFLAFLIFYISFFLANFLTLALLLGNSRRGLLISVFTIIFLLLRQFKLTSVLSLIFLTASFFSIEIYFSRR